MKTTTAVQPIINAYWDQRAPTYAHDQVAPGRAQREWDIWNDRLSAHLPAPGSALDVGTGSGYVARILDQLGWLVTGIDTSEGMLAQARNLSTGPTFLHGDAVNPGHDLGRFDLITNRYLLWTLRDPAKALENWIDLLTPGGRVTVIDAHHYPDGVDTIRANSTGEGTGSFADHYNSDVLAELPLALTQDTGDYVRIFEGAGLIDVSVTRVPEIASLGQNEGVPVGHSVIEPFIISGRKA